LAESESDGRAPDLQNNEQRSEDIERRRRLNDMAFNTWKREVSRRENTTGDEEESEYSVVRRTEKKRQLCEIAFKNWLENKNQQLNDMNNCSAGFQLDPQRSSTGTGIFVISCTDVIESVSIMTS